MVGWLSFIFIYVLFYLLRSLNEIAKCGELSQQEKSERAGRLIKSNPNVSRLLLKLKNEKSLNATASGAPGTVHQVQPQCEQASPQAQE